MRPEVAGDADPGKEAPPTDRTEVGRGCAVGAGSSGLLHLAFLLGLLKVALFCCVSSC